MVKITYSKIPATLRKWKDTVLISNESGEFSFNAEYFTSLHIEKNGYWIYDTNQGWTDMGISNLYPGNKPFNQHYADFNEVEPSYTCDSFKVKMFLKKIMDIHIHNSTGVNPNDMFLYSWAGAKTVNAESGPQFFSFSGNYQTLNPTADNVLKVPVYVNALNHFTIMTNLDMDRENTYYTNSIYIDSSTAPDLNINF